MQHANLIIETTRKIELKQQAEATKYKYVTGMGGPPHTYVPEGRICIAVKFEAPGEGPKVKGPNKSNGNPTIEKQVWKEGRHAPQPGREHRPNTQQT